METKICCECGQELPVDQFNWRNKKAGERQSRCRKCFSEYNRKRYASNREKFKADVKRYKEQNAEKVLETRIKTCLKNPNHRNAYKVVEAAIKAGAIKKPDRCQICGKIPTKRIEAHHDDYEKPLDVVWCCTLCHDRLDQDRRRRLGLPYHSGVRPVRCIETGETFDSVTSASKAIGKSTGSLSGCLTGKTATCAGLHWEYA